MDGNETFTSDLAIRLREMRIEHRSLDLEISQLMERVPHADQLLIQRLKKRKLWLKDAIVKLESQRIPNLDA